MRHGHLDQSTPIILLYFDNIPISPYGHALWPTLLSRRQESLLFLVMAHKLNLHTEEFWDVPDAGSWINIKALRVDMCLLGSSKHRGEIFFFPFFKAKTHGPTLFSRVETNQPVCQLFQCSICYG